MFEHAAHLGRARLPGRVGGFVERLVGALSIDELAARGERFHFLVELGEIPIAERARGCGRCGVLREAPYRGFQTSLFVTLPDGELLGRDAIAEARHLGLGFAALQAFRQPLSEFVRVFGDLLETLFLRVVPRFDLPELGDFRKARKIR